MTTPEETEARLLQIIEVIRALTPATRRRLLRRLRILGLWEPDEFLSDQDRLRVAPALGVEQRVRRPSPAHLDESPKSPPPKSPPPDSATSTVPNEPRSQPDVGYRSAVSGKVVIAGPRDEATTASQSMAPPPGRAPQEPIAIIFDGGTRGDPARGYGSYAIRWPGKPQEVVRLRFAANVTGDEAEYDTLIASLEATLQRLQDNDAAPETARLDIRGDSRAVLGQVRGYSDIDDAALRVRCERVRALLRRFSSWTLSRYHRDPGTEVQA